MYSFICSLALADLGYLAFWLQACYFLSDRDLWDNKDNYNYIWQVIFPMWNAFKALSDFIVICMTIDRCRVISNIEGVRLHAIRGEEEEKHWSVYLQLLGTLVLSFGLHAPQFFKEQCNPDTHDLSTSEVTTTSQPPKCLERESDLWMIYNILYYTFVKIVPVVLVVVLNFILVKKLRIIYRRRKRLRDQNLGQHEHQHQARRKAWSVISSTSLREQRMAYLLVALAFVYLVLTMPANITFIYFVANDGNAPVVWTSATNLLESLNYSLNFYVYCVVHREIRDCFAEMMTRAFCCRGPADKKSDAGARGGGITGVTTSNNNAVLSMVEIQITEPRSRNN